MAAAVAIIAALVVLRVLDPVAAALVRLTVTGAPIPADDVAIVASLAGLHDVVAA